jgi:hypothetical protein
MAERPGQVQWHVGPSSTILHELIDHQSDVLRDLTKKQRGNVTTGVKRHRCAPAIGMPVLAVRTAPANLHETKTLKNARHHARFQDGRLGHA